MRRTRLESSVEGECCRIARRAGFIPIKLYGAGLPDRLFVCPIRSVYIEFKRPKKGTLRMKQRTVHKKFLALGHVVYTVTSITQFKKILLLP